MHLMECEICVKQGYMDYYENLLKSRIHINKYNRLNNIRNFCDISKDKINKSCRNKHMKKYADRNLR